MQLSAIGLNHHKTPIAIRERFALPRGQLQEGLIALRDKGVGEVAILSTCNRTEIYCHSTDITPVQDWLCTVGQMSPARLTPHLFIAPSRQAVRHIFRVCAGLDSMVLGEANIFGQFKEAVRLAQEKRTLGRTLHRLFQSAFATAKEIRHTTAIGRHGVSMASVALQLAENIFGDIADTRVLFIGTGEMINLSAMHFCARRPSGVMFLSRDGARAQAMVRRFGGEAGLVGDIEQVAHEFDIIVSCTDTTLPIIGAGLANRALRARAMRPMMMMDLGVPRNIEPEAGALSDVFLYTIDDLQSVINANVHNRHTEGAKAELIIEARVEAFMRYLDHRRGHQTITEMRQWMNDSSQENLDRALRALERGEPAQEVLSALIHRLGNRWLHPWLAHLHEVEGKPYDNALHLYQAILSQTKTLPPPPGLPDKPAH